MIRPECESYGFSRRTGRAHLLSAHGAGPAHLLSAQEEGPAHLLSAQEEGPAHLISAQAAGSAHLLSAQTSELIKSEVTLLDLRLGQPILAYQSGNVIPSLVVDYGQRAIVTIRTTGQCLGVLSMNEMARRGNGRRGGRTGGRTGGRNGGRGRIPARQEHSEEGSVHTEPTVSVHGTEQTQVAEQPFTFEPEVRAAIAREFSELMKNSLPSLLAEALKKVNGEGGSSAATGAQNNETDNAPPARGCDYKSFKASSVEQIK
ncbi:hypothetical protein L1987_81064 [Smallanthus sonchifolius]|uniref:Uncharacterized protein n=1 Tax=Smallanthus sonchifolius TaxID=185202 RepID=A0ACB8YQZ9_9ASTR|nr:hypothetical protein L1987_81064 [Smallanthus sonchifolius]